MKLRLFALAAFISIGNSYAAGLPSLNIDPSGISVSGLSAGAFMAVQLGVAYSSVFTGVGVFAGGIYACSDGSVVTAQIQCMNFPDQLNVQHYISVAEDAAKSGGIDGTENIRKQRIYLYAGTQDQTVKPVAAKKLQEFYSHFTDASQIATRFDIPSAHGQPTQSFGNACGNGTTPWILNCNYDGAGAALSQFYGTLASPTAAVDGNMIAFDQSPYAPDAALMDSTGYLYVPAKCSDGHSICRLHVALHGCEQSPDMLGDTYRVHAGYNEWAEANGIVVLYPSTKKSSGNPNACWDWWGYTDKNFARQSGPQMAAIRKMVRAISGI